MESYELSVDQIFSDNMILPRGKSFQMGGTGEPGSTVKIAIGEFTQRTIVNRHGIWNCRFAPISDTEQVFEVQIEDEHRKIILKNVRFGHVILMAGQSNIGFRMSQDQDFEEERTKLQTSQIAYYNAPQASFVYQNGKVEEYQSKTTCWHQLKAENLGHMSAIAFYAAKKMCEADPKVPVGIVCCTKDGSLSGTWISEATMRSDKVLFERIVQPFEQRIKAGSDHEFEEAIQEYKEKVRRHNRRMYNFLKDNPTVPMGEAINVVGQTPWPPPITPDSYLKPGALFKAMVLRLKNYGFNQAIWYQGETDVNHGDIYDRLLSSIISDWRAAFQDYSLPFYVIQLPKYADVPRNSWAELRQQQLKVARQLDQVHLVSITDMGDLYNPHPVEKRPIGERLGRILTGEAYTDTPVFEQVVLDGDLVRLKFKFVDQIHTTQPCRLEGLVNNQWQTIEAEVKFSEIEVQTPNGTTQLRYGYSNTPTLTLFNEHNDPIAPFLVNLKNGELI